VKWNRPQPDGPGTGAGLGEHAVHSRTADTERSRDSAGRLTARMHPLRQSSFRLVEFLGLSATRPETLASFPPGR
jgi:hypothetical protein